MSLPSTTGRAQSQTPLGQPRPGQSQAALPKPPPQTGPSGQKGLSQRAKAAVVVQFLIQEGADISLASLPPELQAELTHQLGSMRYIDRDTLQSVMEEFANELDSIGMRLPGGIAGALNALEGKIDPSTSRRLRKETGARRLGDPWERIASLPPERLIKVALAESTEVAAVMLSKLDVGKAAELLSQLPGPKAQKIAYAISMTANVTPEAVDRIGLSIATQLDDDPLKAFDETPESRMGAILNSSSPVTRDELLDGLTATDEDFAKAVRKAIFTFANIPARVEPLDIPKITRDVDQAVLVTALAGATLPDDSAAATFLLDNLSKRMAQTLRDEINERGAVPEKEAESAMAEVVGALRNLAQTGEITFRAQEDAPS